MSDKLLISTRKGLFTVARNPVGQWEIEGVDFLERQPGPIQDLAGRGDRSRQHHHRVRPDLREIDEASSRPNSGRLPFAAAAALRSRDRSNMTYVTVSQALWMPTNTSSSVAPPTM